jgi:hypothetical protein
MSSYIMAEQREPELLSSKTKIIIIPENHAQVEITNSLSSLVKLYIDETQIPSTQILNFSEGEENNIFYKSVYKKDKTLYMVEKSQKVLERHPVLFNCLYYLTVILVEIQIALDMIYTSTPDQIASYTGLLGQPYDTKYVSNVIISAYNFNSFINVEEDLAKGKDSFYNLFNTTYLNALNPERRDAYEERLQMLLTNAQPYFKQCDGSIDSINFTQVFDELKKLKSPQQRTSYIIEKKRELRAIRDTMIFERIQKAIPEKGIKLVIIIIGGNHYKNMKRIVEESPNLTFTDLQPRIEKILSGILSISDGGKKIKKNKTNKKKKKKRTIRKYNGYIKN